MQYAVAQTFEAIRQELKGVKEVVGENTNNGVKKRKQKWRSSLKEFSLIVAVFLFASS